MRCAGGGTCAATSPGRCSTTTSGVTATRSGSGSCTWTSRRNGAPPRRAPASTPPWCAAAAPPCSARHQLRQPDQLAVGRRLGREHLLERQRRDGAARQRHVRPGFAVRQALYGGGTEPCCQQYGGGTEPCCQQPVERPG